jgi:hypothetical protein
MNDESIGPERESEITRTCECTASCQQWSTSVAVAVKDNRKPCRKQPANAAQNSIHNFTYRSVLSQDGWSDAFTTITAPCLQLALARLALRWLNLFHCTNGQSTYWFLTFNFHWLSKQNRSWKNIAHTTNIMMTLTNIEQSVRHSDIISIPARRPY